jgi:hypothetical protein
MPIGRFAFATCTYGRFIFVLGGVKEIVQVDHGQPMPDPLVECDSYDALNDEWGEMPDLPEGRIGASAVCVGQTLYCIGGIGKRTNIFSHSLKGDSNKWEEIRGDMSLLCHSACFYLPPLEDEDGSEIKFVVFGGVDHLNQSSSAITNLVIKASEKTFTAT